MDSMVRLFERSDKEEKKSGVNMNNKDKIRLVLNAPRTLIVYGSICTNRGLKQAVDEDAAHWWKPTRPGIRAGRFAMFTVIAGQLKEFRNLVEVRIKQNRGVFRRGLLHLFFRPLSSLYIFTVDIGPRLFIQHGFSTVINAKSIGSDCYINQQVTIGSSWAADSPTLGNGVRVTAGAKVLGDIVLGDNCIVGANAVVVKDVGENLVVGGVPAKVISVNERHRLHPAELAYASQ